jgi:hypothetical protein
VKKEINKKLYDAVTAQIRKGAAKARNFLEGVEASVLYLLFIGERAAYRPPKRPPEAAVEQDLLKKAAQALTRSEKSTKYLLYNTTHGMLLLTADFNVLFDCYLLLAELQSGQKTKQARALGLGTEICITSQASFAEDMGMYAQRAAALADLAAHPCLCLSRAVYEAQKKNLYANKKIRIQKYGAFRLPEDKTPTDVYHITAGRGGFFYPSGYIFGRKTLSRLAAALVIGAAVVAVPLARVKVFQPTRVILQGSLPSAVYLDYKQDEPIKDIWDPEYKGYVVTAEVLPGRHILSYDESPDKRFFQPILVRNGDNPVLLEWQKTELPYTYLWVDYTDKDEWVSDHSYKGRYVIYDRETFEPLVKNVAIALKVVVRPNEGNALQFLFNWDISENDKTLSTGGRVLDWDPRAGKVYKDTIVMVSKNDYVFYHYSVRIDQKFFRLYMSSSFIEYIHLAEEK